MANSKIWFVQVKRRLLDLPLNEESGLAVFFLILHLFSHSDSEEVIRTEDWGRMYDTLLDLELITESGMVNRQFLSNSRHDRDFLQTGARLTSRTR